MKLFFNPVCNTTQLTILWQYLNVTDRRTERGLAVAIPRDAKNY